MQCPGQSSDLSLIEMLLQDLKSTVHKWMPANFNELKLCHKEIKEDQNLSTMMWCTDKVIQKTMLIDCTSFWMTDYTLFFTHCLCISASSLLNNDTLLFTSGCIYWISDLVRHFQILDFSYKRLYNNVFIYVIALFTIKHVEHPCRNLIGMSKNYLLTQKW